ncbi:iqgap- protein [Recurvomyces mirabilis]|nr:iqgap- protein [Recurvomyces mirabilis]
MSQYAGYNSPKSPPHQDWRSSSPQKPSPLRHTLSTISRNSDTENTSEPSRQGTINSQSSSVYSHGSNYSGYDSTSDPFVTRSSAKRERSESPVKKNAAFAKWEQREQQTGTESRDHPSRSPSKMDVTPRRIRDDEWKSGVGRKESESEGRSALRPIELNTRTDSAVTHTQKMAREMGSPTKENGNPLPQLPMSDHSMRPPPRPPSHYRGQSLDTTLSATPDHTFTTSPPSISTRNSLATLSRSDSMRASTRPRERGHSRFNSVDNSVAQLDGEDLATLQNSTTPQLRHLSKMASENGGGEDMGVHSPEEQVVGLAGRRKLQRSGPVKPNSKGQSNFSSQFASTRWMDTQRKHIQAYEYLCHIGEARAWLEDVLDPTELPPIVQLEEALRDGVTLAEVVVRLAPSLPLDQQRGVGAMRIFRSTRLQFRHSDNIAMFFRFLGEIELPELFRFELVDLYEKKNIPKVIYCIHALSWLLFRKGIVDIRIGNLVGQLHFEEHELEATQKGIERSGVAMPNFGGMREALQVEPEPEPSPEELLAEQEEVLVDLQAQARGALMRLRLGEMMQDLWDAEDAVARLQAHARGGFAREVFAFKFGMEHSARAFQAAAKGFLVRRKQHRKQRAWRESKDAVVKVQSLWRGRQERAETMQIRSQLQRQRHGLKDLQAAIRGALGRWQVSDVWQETQEAGTEVEAFQAQARGALERLRVGEIMNRLWDVEDSILELQAYIRGSRIRRQGRQQQVAAKQASVDIVRLQAVARGLVQRREIQRHHGQFKMHEGAVMDVQAAARGLLTRLRQARTKGALQGRESGIVKVQALLRANLARHCVRMQKAELLTSSSSLPSLQALARGNMRRQQLTRLREDLKQHDAEILQLQSMARAMLQRREIGTKLAALEDQETDITTLQSLARAYMHRQRIFEQLVAMEKEEESITHLQALARAMLLRSHIGSLLSELEDHENEVMAFQSAARAFVVRAAFAQKQKHYRENMQKVIKLQSFVRAKQQGESYKSLVNGKNPPLPVVRRHLHLLTDNNLDFEGELEAERLRRQVVESVRRNELVEGYVEGLDVKIALLVKNKITLDEVVKHQKHFGGSASQLLRQGSTLGSASGFDLKALNKSSRKKLTGYEELFFMLQTQPLYLARLFQAVTARGLAEKEAKGAERLVLTLFGNALKSREEFLLLKVLAQGVGVLVEGVKGLDELVRVQQGAFQQRLVLAYLRNPGYRSYLKSLLGGMVREGICGEEHLDLESDPLMIYRALINNEELSTGQPSRRPRDLPREQAIREGDVRPTYVQHLQDLRDICDGFFLSLEETLHRMPFGIRYLASEQYRILCLRFPHEDPGHLAMLAGQWLWKSYLLPALREPEMWGVVDRGLNPVHKRNLGQVVVVLGQVAQGRLFGSENLYLQPLNNWVSESLDRWHEALMQVFDLPPAEEFFDADQYSDFYSRTKPTLYIKLGDIFALHSLVSENLAAVAPGRDDAIKELLTDLGSAKSNESDLSGASNGGEITLTLKSRFSIQEDPNAEARALFMATKRPITHEDADKWIEVVREEVAEKERDHHGGGGGRHHHKRGSSSPAFDPRASLRGARAHSVYSEAPSAYSEDRRDLPQDLESMTYAELKHSALENILVLEQSHIPAQFRVSRHNAYQDLLNALAADIRQKHRRRMDRSREVEGTRATLAGLDDKAHFLEEQLKSYNDYIEQCLHTLANKKGTKSKFVLPFTKQWSHERELEKAGRQPKFGSYKYSARQLADKGVLLSWPAYAPEHWGQVNVVVSSDEVGVFHFEASEGSMMVPGGSANLLLDDLLQAQYDGRDRIGIFEGMEGGGGQGQGAKVGVNLLLHLLFKKFYRDD